MLLPRGRRAYDQPTDHYRPQISLTNHRAYEGAGEVPEVGGGECISHLLMISETQTTFETLCVLLPRGRSGQKTPTGHKHNLQNFRDTRVAPPPGEERPTFTLSVVVGVSDEWGHGACSSPGGGGRTTSLLTTTDHK